jgi:hypothetical protein
MKEIEKNVNLMKKFLSMPFKDGINRMENIKSFFFLVVLFRERIDQSGCV